MTVKKTLIVFDIDGTLTDTVLLHQKAFTKSLKALGVKQMDTNYNEYLHHTDSYIAKCIYEKDKGENFSNSIIGKFQELLLEEIKGSPFKEIKGAGTALRILKEENHAVCFATGALLDTAIYKLKKLQLPFDKELVVASNSFHSREEIVMTAIEKAKRYYQVSAFERIISVGDGLWDLKTAQKLDLNFIGIGEKNKNVLLEHGAKTVLQDLTNFTIPLLLEDHPVS